MSELPEPIDANGVNLSPVECRKILEKLGEAREYPVNTCGIRLDRWADGTVEVRAVLPDDGELLFTVKGENNEN